MVLRAYLGFGIWRFVSDRRTLIKNYDYVIVGSGIAGLYTALLAREHGSVLLVTKGSIEDCNTRHAQGGIAAAIGVMDSPELPGPNIRLTDCCAALPVLPIYSPRAASEKPCLKARLTNIAPPRVEAPLAMPILTLVGMSVY